MKREKLLFSIGAAITLAIAILVFVNKNTKFSITSMDEIYNYHADEYFIRRSNPDFIHIDYVLNGRGSLGQQCAYISNWIMSNKAIFTMLSQTNTVTVNYRFFKNSFNLREQYGQLDQDMFWNFSELRYSFFNNKDQHNNGSVVHKGECVKEGYISEDYLFN